MNAEAAKASESSPEEIILSVTGDSNISDLSDLSGDSTRSKGGRPSGSTFSNKKKREANIIALKNEITIQYQQKILDAAKSGRRVENGTLQKIISSLKKKRKLDDIDIPVKTIRTRIHSNKPVVNNNQRGGRTSPLLKIEDTVIAIKLQMARIRKCLSRSDGLFLVNSLIDEQPIQQELINWKIKYSNNCDGRVGTKYWRGFMSRKKHKIVSV